MSASVVTMKSYYAVIKLISITAGPPTTRRLFGLAAEVDYCWENCVNRCPLFAKYLRSVSSQPEGKHLLWELKLWSEQYLHTTTFICQ